MPTFCHIYLMITYNIPCECATCLSVCSFVNSLKQKKMRSTEAERKDDTFLSTGFHMITFQQLKDSLRRGRDIARQTDSHTSHIDRMETIHILTIVYRLNYFLF